MRILVIGDACIDEYRYGEILRINPESTAPLLNFEKLRCVSVSNRPARSATLIVELGSTFFGLIKTWKPNRMTLAFPWKALMPL